MANKKLYDEKTGEGWARVAGKWHYFQDGKIIDTGFEGAQETSRKWIKDTTKKAKDIRQQAIEREERYVPQVMSTHKTPITTALTEEVLPKTWDLTKRGAKNLKNAFSDIPKIGQGSGEFNDKGRELSVFELRRQKEKYQEQEKSKNLSMWNVSPESLDIEIEPLELDFSNMSFDPKSDFGKTWGIDTSGFDIETNLTYQNGFKSAQILNALDGANSSVFETKKKAEEEKKKLSVANLKNTNEKVLGGKPDELAIKTELGKNLRKTNFGGTDPGQSLWLGKNSTWTMGGNVVAPKVGTSEAEAMMNIPETPDATIAEEIVTDPVDPVEVDKGLGVQDTSKLVDQSVKVEPKLPTPEVAPEVSSLLFKDLMKYEGWG